MVPYWRRFVTGHGASRFQSLHSSRQLPCLVVVNMQVLSTATAPRLPATMVPTMMTVNSLLSPLNALLLSCLGHGAFS